MTRPRGPVQLGAMGTSTAENDIGLSRSITVTVDGDGLLSETDIPQEGYVSGVYRVTTSTNYPVEGLIETFTAVDGAISSGVWAAASLADAILMELGDDLLLESGDRILLE